VRGIGLSVEESMTSKSKKNTGKVLITGNYKLVKLDRAGLRRDIRKILELLGVGERELSLLLVDDAQIRTINREYLMRDRPTNVIAFSLSEGAFGEVNPGMLGDVVVSVETAAREAKAAGIPVGDAILNLILHGILHLTGYDHEGTGGRARVMAAVQEVIFLEIREYRLAVKL
jgi:probable rRNA maturation factor